MSKERIEELTLLLDKATHLYYNEATSIMLDKEFDMCMRELEALEKAFPEYARPDSPTKRVGADHTSGFVKVKHVVPMISIGNAYSVEEVQTFWEGLNREAGKVVELTAEPKIDGLSLGLRYANGVLIQAVTRGDGEEGDDVTENSKTIKDIPLEIPYKGELEVRGECYLSRKQFDAINRALESSGSKTLQNPRNAAAGALKTKVVKEVARKGLSFRAFGLATDLESVDTQTSTVTFLETQGFTNANKVKVIPSIEAFNEFQRLLGIARKEGKLPFDIDGIVLKVNEVGIRESFGRTGKAIRWATAFKFDSDQAKTRVLSVTFQTGRTGKVVPVAELEPVLLMGTLVRRATLHNMDEIGRLDLHVGDTVIIEKGGDIIPKVISVDISERAEGAVKVVSSGKCPICGAPLEKRPGMIVDVFCSGAECPAKVLNCLKYFVSRTCLNIKDLGESLLEKLLDNDAIKTPLDLYSLQPIHFDGMAGVGPKMVGKVLDSIDSSKTASPAKLLTGMGIPGVGKETCNKVMSHLGGWEAFWVASEQQLAMIPEVGDKAAASLISWRDDNTKFLERIKEIGMVMVQSTTTNAAGALAGEVVVVTGDLSTMSREEARQAIEEEGGRFVDSVSKKTTFLVVGSNPGASKLSKAELHNTPILSEMMFLERIGR
jgi:DNA ligase (NAD+)